MIGLNSLPRGLIEIVGAVTAGQNIRQMQEFVQPSLDLMIPYLLNQQEDITGAIGPIAGLGQIAGPAAAKVPAGEIWYVWNLSLAVVTGAGQTVTFAPAFAHLGSLQMVGDYSVSAPNQNWKAGSWHPFWVNSGSQLCGHCSTLTAGPIAVADLHAIVTRLKA